MQLIRQCVVTSSTIQMMRQSRQQAIVKPEFKLNDSEKSTGYGNISTQLAAMEKSHRGMEDNYKKEMLLRRTVQKDNCQLERKLAAMQKRIKRLENTITGRDKKILDNKKHIRQLRAKCRALAKEKELLRMEHRKELRDVHGQYQDMLNYTSTSKEVLRITEEKKAIKKEKKKLEAENNTLKKKNKELVRRDNYNDSAHTPPSKKTMTQKGQKPKKGRKGKSGAKKGHCGSSHHYDKPDETRKVVMNRCNDPDCSSTRLECTGIEKILTEEMVPAWKKTIENNVSYYNCLSCGKKHQRADDPQLRNGRYGPNAVIQVVLNYIHRMPNRLNAEHIALLASIMMSPGTIHKILKRFCNRLIPNAKVMAQYMRRARILHVDETSISLNGKNAWMWTFFDPKSKRVMFVIRKSRGSDVPREILGDDWNGTLVADGWSAYARYVVQRCTAHLIREVRNMADKNPDDKDAAHALSVFRRILRDAKKDITHDMQNTQHRRLTQRMLRMINKYRTHSLLNQCMKKLERALPDTFRFVLDSEIPADNNPAERHLREPVVHRKIRGCIRSEETMEWLGALFTCVSTWKCQGLDYVKELAKYA